MSGSLGATYDFSKMVYAKANVAQGWRAPNVAEAGANGVHDGTPVYELGDHNLKPETSLEEDLTFGINSKDVNFEATGFVNTINDFIYSRALQSVFGGDSMNSSLAAVFLQSAPVYKYSEGKAMLSGSEAGLDIHPSTIPWIDLNSTVSMVDGGLQNIPDSVKYLPFVPPMRITVDLKFKTKKLCSGIRKCLLQIRHDECRGSRIISIRNRLFSTVWPSPHLLLNTPRVRRPLPDTRCLMQASAEKL